MYLWKGLCVQRRYRYRLEEAEPAHYGLMGSSSLAVATIVISQEIASSWRGLPLKCQAMTRPELL